MAMAERSLLLRTFRDETGNKIFFPGGVVGRVVLQNGQGKYLVFPPNKQELEEQWRQLKEQKNSKEADIQIYPRPKAPEGQRGKKRSFELEIDIRPGDLFTGIEVPSGEFLVTRVTRFQNAADSVTNGPDIEDLVNGVGDNVDHEDFEERRQRMEEKMQEIKERLDIAMKPRTEE